MPVSYRLGAFYLAYFAYVGAMVAYFPPYLAARGLAAKEIAWLLALPPAIRIFAPTPWGWLADRTGAQRAIVVFSCLVNAALFLVLPSLHSPSAMAWLVAACAVLAAAALPLVEAIALGALAGQAGRYGPIRLWGSVGFIVAVLGCGAWFDRASVLGLPAIMVACALAAVLFGAMLPAGRPARHEAAKRGIVSRAAAALLAAGFCMSVAHGALYAFLTLHLQREGYGASVIGLAWTLGVLAEIVLFLYLPALFQRYRLSSVLMASFGCAALRFLLIGWAAGVGWILFVAQLLHAATFGAFHAASVATIHRVFPAGAHARGQTLFSSLSYGAGGAAGSLIAGWAWEGWGPEVAFTLSSVAGLAGLLFAYSLRVARL